MGRNSYEIVSYVWEMEKDDGWVNEDYGCDLRGKDRVF